MNLILKLSTIGETFTRVITLLTKGPFVSRFKKTRKLYGSKHERFSYIFNLYGKKLYNFSYKYTQCTSQSEEIVKNTFLTIWRDWHRLDASLSFDSYIIAIAKDHILDSLKKKANRHSHATAIKDKINDGEPSLIR